MRPDEREVRRAARRHYEIGRAWLGARRAAPVAVVVAAVSTALFGARALAWIPLTLLTLTFTEWRGLFVMKGARRGLLAGFASMLVPLSILRPCCGIDAVAMGATCCVMPSACWRTGAAVGLLMALFLPKAPEGHRAEAALGMILGVISIAAVRCSMLFLGEGIGLLGGMAAGIVATSLGRAWMNRSPSLA